MSLPNSNSYDNLGGTINDYASVVDPTTDLPASASNETRSDVAAMTRTAIRGWVYFLVSAGDIVPDSVVYDSVFGNSNTYKPTVAYNNTGDYTVTFPSSIVDSLGETQTVNLQVSFANFYGAGIFASSSVSSSTTIEVFLYDINSPGLTDPPNPTDKVIVFVS